RSSVNLIEILTVLRKRASRRGIWYQSLSTEDRDALGWKDDLNYIKYIGQTYSPTSASRGQMVIGTRSRSTMMIMQSRGD
ncbi:MAG TPA: hypothetical protein VJP79_04040, partial [Nitrososphaera sp.]|nr:hypothetical protein [Nitrososphaera sp.]